MKLVGRIIVFIPNRKFGFIHTNEGQEFFFHQTNYAKGVPVLSTNVEFEVAPAIREGKAPMAVNVTPIDFAPAVTPAERKYKGGAL